MKNRIFLSLFSFVLLQLLLSPFAEAKELNRTVTKDIPYYSEATLAEADDYQKSQCKLDISAPEDAAGLPVFVWFHGGGLTGGGKHFPGRMNEARVVLVAVGYRLSPKADYPAFFEDAAAAVAWTFANIERFGGDPKKIFVGGHSAGAYLSAMIGMDPRWLKSHDIDRSRIAGLILISGQVTTHFQVRKMLKYPQPEFRPVIDENAPLYHMTKEAPPMLIVMGDRRIEWPARVEENEFMAASLRAMKHPHVEFHENENYDHGQVGNAPEAFEQIKGFMEKIAGRD